MRRPTRLLGAAALAAVCAIPAAVPAAVRGVLQEGSDGARRFSFEIDENALAGAPDFSALNRPLDAGSRLVVQGAHFHRVGADGRPGTSDDVPTRLFGANLTFSASFPSSMQAVQLAKRLRKLGFNAVRLHHLDSRPGRETDPPGSVLTPDAYPAFNPEAIARLRNFIRVLAGEGIYVNLNLRVGYRFRPGVDGVPELPPNMPVSAPLHVYHPRMVALQQEYARQLLQALDLKGNPALAMVEISNESSLLAAWQRREWQYAAPPGYAPVLEQRWQDWLRREYGSTAAACAAWGVSCPAGARPVPLVPPDEPDAPGSLLQDMAGRVSATFGRLAGDVLGRRTHGNAAPAGRALRVHDFLRFLADTDRAYFDAMRAVVHEQTDALVPVTGTQMVYGGTLNFDSQAGMDYLDEHFYVAHPEFPSGWNLQDWRIPDVSLTGGQLRGLLALSLRRDLHRPFVLSEFNQPFPHPRSAEALPLAAAVASLQDWNGVFFFDYASDPEPHRTPDTFGLSGDWGKYALAGQTAMLFRAGVPAPIEKTLALSMPLAARAAGTAANAYDGLQTLVAERYGVVPEMAWQARLGVDLREAAPDPALPAPVQPPFATPSRSLRFDPVRQQAVLDTEGAWGAFGMLAGLDARAGRLHLQGPDNAEPLPAAMLMTPLDGRPLAQARRLLLSLTGATRGTQPGSIPARPQELVDYPGRRGWLTFEPEAGSQQPSGPMATRGPAWLSQPSMRLGWPAAETVSIFPLDGKGARTAPLPAECMRREGDLIYASLTCAAAAPSPWYEIVVAPGPTAEDTGRP